MIEQSITETGKYQSSQDLMPIRWRSAQNEEKRIKFQFEKKMLLKSSMGYELVQNVCTMQQNK